MMKRQMISPRPKSPTPQISDSPSNRKTEKIKSILSKIRSKTSGQVSNCPEDVDNDRYFSYFFQWVIDKGRKQIVKDGTLELVYSLIDYDLYNNNKVLFEPTLRLLGLTSDMNSEAQRLIGKNKSRVKIMLSMDKLNLEQLEIDSLWCILCNICQNDSNRSALYAVGMNEFFINHIKHKNERLRIFSTMGLATLTGADESAKTGMIITNKEHITTIIGFLKDLRDTHSQVLFSIYEVALALRNLAINDKNKILLIECGILPVVLKYLKEIKDIDDIKILTSLLVHLSFERLNHKSMVDSGLIPIVEEKLVSHSDKTINKGGNQLLWILRSEKEHLTTVKAKEGVHIMISYCWDQQDLVLKIRESLRQKVNFPIWIDVEQLSGSASNLIGMSAAVEDSALILCCMSPNYKESQNCRVEAEYTYKTQKKIIPLIVSPNYKPDGWLGILLGTMMYVDFASNESLYDEKMNELTTQIEKHLATMSKNVNKMIHQESSQSILALKRSVENWKTGDICMWLKDKGYGSSCKYFEKEKISGKAICHMKQIANNDFGTFSQILKTLGIKDLNSQLSFSYDLSRIS